MQRVVDFIIDSSHYGSTSANVQVSEADYRMRVVKRLALKTFKFHRKKHLCWNPFKQYSRIPVTILKNSSITGAILSSLSEQLLVEICEQCSSNVFLNSSPIFYN